jgi:excisionase family DNA binding protein
MVDRIVIPLPGIGTLELSREAYEAALRPIQAATAAAIDANPRERDVELVTARTLAQSLSLPISCIYEYAKAGRIPCIRAGKHVRFNVAAVLDVLRTTGGLTVGQA